MAAYGLAAAVIYMIYEIRNDNSVSGIKKKENEIPYQIEGTDLINYPWCDDVHNLNPNNNGSKRIENWNLKKIQLEGQFLMKPTIGTISNY